VNPRLPVDLVPGHPWHGLLVILVADDHGTVDGALQFT
jgi:hypothetical protein